MLKNLYVMKIDAKQELDNMNGAKEIERFKNLIIVPDGLSIDSLLDGERYYLYGEKGAGKTAMLIYTALKAEELFNAERSFIIFKEFSQEEREDYTGLAHVTQYNQGEIVQCLDYEYVWWWVFHNNIAETLLSSTKEIFIQDEAYYTYLAAVKSIASNPRGDKRKMPIINKDGYVEASIKVPIGGVEINLAGKVNFEANEKKDKIRFSTHINELNRLFMNLEAGDSQLYIVVDEMNLSTKNTEEFERDVLMIRDLIIAIERFNAISKNSHSNVRVIGSIRNEVINSVKTRGKEINKAVESYGIPIDWTRYSEDNLCHPLIKLLINYFRISDELHGVKPCLTDMEEYKRWVDDKIFNVPSEEIIRNFTLYRPRHVVRFLNLSKLVCGSERKISTNSFNTIKRQYSRDCWSEITEELSLSYTPNELELIKEWLTGMPWQTTYAIMYEKAIKQWAGSHENLLARFDELMRDLYKSGIIGNYRRSNYPNPPTHRWYFRGDETLLKNQDIQIHRIFSTVLSTVRPE